MDLVTTGALPDVAEVARIGGLFAALVEWAGVTLPIRVTGDPLEARHLESGNSTLLYLFNHGRETARSAVSLRRERPVHAALDLTTGASVPLIAVEDGVMLKVEIPPAGVQALQLTTR